MILTWAKPSSSSILIYKIHRQRRSPLIRRVSYYVRLAVSYLPVPLVWRFMQLSFASSQNSLASTMRARNYDDLVLLHLIEKVFDVNKGNSIPPHTIPNLTLPLHTYLSSTPRAPFTSLSAWPASTAIAWITRCDSYPTLTRFLSLACKRSSHYRRGPPILAPGGGPEVVTSVYP